MSQPDGTLQLWRHDRTILRASSGLIGVDEAGRGCLAGPVFAAAVHLPAAFFDTSWRSRKAPRIDDSKKLKIEERREALRFLLRLRDESGVRISVGIGEVSEIEEHNILGATTIAMRRALEGLAGTVLPGEEEHLPLWSSGENTSRLPRILVDGRPVARLGYAHQSLVKGDGKSLAIALASVLAKVERDACMERAHRDFPFYGWDTNRGYGTEAHLAGLRERGPCPLHRKLFLRKITNPS